jgi:hypothetical protein
MKLTLWAKAYNLFIYPNANMPTVKPPKRFFSLPLKALAGLDPYRKYTLILLVCPKQAIAKSNNKQVTHFFISLIDEIPVYGYKKVPDISGT